MSLKIVTIDKSFEIKVHDSLTAAGKSHGFSMSNDNSYNHTKPYRFRYDIVFCEADKIKDFSREILNQIKIKAQTELNAKYINALTKINKM